MHMLEFTQIVAVDMEGNTWRKIHKSTSDVISIHEAQGQLCLCTTDTLNRYELSIWILEDYSTSKWTLKHKVTTLELFGKKNIEIGIEVCDAAYRVIVVQSEWNLIFLVGEDKTLLVLTVINSYYKPSIKNEKEYKCNHHHRIGTQLTEFHEFW
jgi:hypothetical protein